MSSGCTGTARPAGDRRWPTSCATSSRARLLEGDIDRSALVDLGLRYLADAEAMSAASLATPDVVGADGVRLNSLHLQNFRQHADSRITFDTGLTGIIGPNGSGKTTILEAIAWALYGNSAARGTRESLRFNRAAARATVKVELDFELAGHRYRVVRGLTNAELYLDNARVPIANSITAVTELLHRRLGMTRTEFFNTYFTGQKELNVMAAMGPSERAKFLSRVLGYEKLRTAQDLVREQRKLITAETAGLRSGMPDRETVERILAEAGARLAVAERQLAVAERSEREFAAALAAATPAWERVQGAARPVAGVVDRPQSRGAGRGRRWPATVSGSRVSWPTSPRRVTSWRRCAGNWRPIPRS